MPNLILANDFLIFYYLFIYIFFYFLIKWGLIFLIKFGLISDKIGLDIKCKFLYYQKNKMSSVSLMTVMISLLRVKYWNHALEIRSILIYIPNTYQHMLCIFQLEDYLDSAGSFNRFDKSRNISGKSVEKIFFACLMVDNVIILNSTPSYSHRLWWLVCSLNFIIISGCENFGIATEITFSVVTQFRCILQGGHD